MAEQIVTANQQQKLSSEIELRTFSLDLPELPLYIGGVAHSFVPDNERIGKVVNSLLKVRKMHTYSLTGASIDYLDVNDQLTAQRELAPVYDSAEGNLSMKLPQSLFGTEDTMAEAAHEVELSLNEQFLRGLATYNQLHVRANFDRAKLVGGAALGAIAADGITQLTILSRGGDVIQYAGGTVAGFTGLMLGTMAAATVITRGGIFKNGSDTRKHYDRLLKEKIESIDQEIVVNGVKDNSDLAPMLSNTCKPLIYIQPLE